MARRTNECRVAVKFTDPDSGHSRSVTVFGIGLHPDDLAFAVEAWLSRRGYRTTKLSDRRHKKRRF